jgi:myosin-7
MKILASILHIGNIKYKATSIRNLDATEITNRKVVDCVSHLLEVIFVLKYQKWTIFSFFFFFLFKFSSKDLIIALTTKTIFTSGETVTSTLAEHQSVDVRDAFVKGIYGRLFICIVEKINAAIYKTRDKIRYNILRNRITNLQRYCRKYLATHN